MGSLNKKLVNNLFDSEIYVLFKTTNASYKFKAKSIILFEISEHKTKKYF